MSQARVMSNFELTLRLQQQELVAAFGRLALRTDRLEDLLQEACRVAATGLETHFAKVLEYQPDQSAFLVAAGVGWHAGVVGHARLKTDLESPAGFAFRTGKPVISNHLAAEGRFRTPALLAEHGVKSAINVLIRARDAAPFGVLEADSTRRGEFNEYDVAFLEALANTLGEAVAGQRRQQARETLLRDNVALVAEKELLMREVHHRVTNSLQIVQNLLSLQSRNVASEEARRHLVDAARRVRVIGAVHRRLYQGGSVTAADAAQYLRGLLADLEQVGAEAGAPRPIALRVTPFSLAADDLTSLGLIASELVTNALKHGRGEIKVEIRQLSDGLEIAVADEGDGFPADFDLEATRGLGMRLVAGLAKAPAPAGHPVRIDRSVPFGRIVVAAGFGGHGGS